MGWSRAQAIAFFEENAILATDNIVNEVDRYIAWPGQALAYKMGEREIRRLRADAEKRLGPRFDVKAFHDLLLGGGAVSLPVLREQIDALDRGRRTGADRGTDGERGRISIEVSSSPSERRCDPGSCPSCSSGSATWIRWVDRT